MPKSGNPPVCPPQSQNDQAETDKTPAEIEKAPAETAELISGHCDVGGGTVRQFLRSRLRLSLTALRRLRGHGRILVNGHRAYPGDLLETGDLIEVWLPETGNASLIPENLGLRVIHEDDSVLVIDKPAGMISHPTCGIKSGTIANGVKWIWDQKGEKRPVRLLGRLDGGTTGVMIIAKTSRVSGALASTDIVKEYLCLVHGLFDEPTGTMDGPLVRVRGDALTRVGKDGKASVTRYKVLSGAKPVNSPIANPESSVSTKTVIGVENPPLPEGFSALLITIETGRTHQIRAHMAHSGHPVAGDDLYGGSLELIGRPALHCLRLSYADPFTGEKVSFSAPVPCDMATALTLAEIDLAAFAEIDSI